MIKQLVTVYDSKAETYNAPVAAIAIGEAIRAFADAVNDGQSPFNKHPEDYTLFHIGTFDDQTCQVEMKEAPVSLGGALQFVTTSA